MQLNGHTLLLVQFSSNEETRTYTDCATPDQAFETFLRIFEQFLINKQSIIKQQEQKNPSTEGGEPLADDAADLKVTYQLKDLLLFIDQLFDMGALCFNERACGYTAHGKAWFKAKCHAYLRRQAGDEVVPVEDKKVQQEQEMEEQETAKQDDK